MKRVYTLFFISGILLFISCTNQKLKEKYGYVPTGFDIIEVSDSSRTMDAVSGDIDNDGDLDLVTANMYNNDGPASTHILLNDGKGNFSLSSQKLSKQTHGVALADLDGDKDLDLIVSSNSADSMGTRIYFNNGGGYFNDSRQKLGSRSGLAVQTGDIDNDGDIDIFCDYYGQKNHLLINNGKGYFTSLEKEITADKYSARLADFNNDGKIDWFIRVPKTGYLIELNRGDLVFEKYFEIEDTTVSWGDMRICDLNNDNYPDVIIKEANKQSQVLINNKEGILISSQEIGLKSRGAKICTGDLNGDGFEDVFIANNFMPDEIYYNDGTGKLINSGNIFGENILSMRPVINDFNNDKLNDIFVSQAMMIKNGKRIEIPNKLYLNSPGKLTTAFDNGDIKTKVGENFNFEIPEKTFYSEQDNRLELDVTEIDKTELPSWLKFDKTKNLLFGIPGKTDTLLLVLKAGQSNLQTKSLIRIMVQE